MTTIYIDELFLLNFIINYLLLLLTAKIAGDYMRRWRLAVSAALGGVYAAASVFPTLGFLGNPFIKLAVAAGMALVAFGGQKRLLRLLLIFLAVSAAMGGAIYGITLLGGTNPLESGLALPVDFKILALSFAGCYGLLTLVFRRAGRTAGRQVVEVEVWEAGHRAKLRALVDTGNALADPFTGGPVIICDITALGPLFSRDVLAAFRQGGGPVETLERLSHSGTKTKFRLIPYAAIGVESGMLLSFRPEMVLVNKKVRQGAVVGISQTSVSDGGAYCALIGGEAA